MEFRRAAACAVAVLALALAACGTTQGERYQSMRQQLDRAPRRADEAGVDSLRSASELSRDALVATVLARNPTIDAARSAWRAALARYPQATALPDPTFSYGARPRSFGSDQVDPANDFALSQPLPFPGKLGLRGERALDEAEAAQSELETERTRLASVASIAFDDYWLAGRALEANAAQRDLLAGARTVAFSRYEAGTGSQQDVLAAETEQAMLEHRQVELETERRIAVERINALLHRPSGLALPPAPRELEPQASPELDEQSLLSHALEARPELRAAQARIRAREADVALARREFLPDFTLRGAYEGSWQEDPLKPLVGIEVNVPLQLGRRRAALEEADARLERERSRLLQLEDRVRLEVALALERLHESWHLLDVSEQRLLPASRSRVAAARAGFASGRVPFLELVEAERALRGAEQSQLEARATLSRRRAELSRALGDVAEVAP
jgi:outer membrane protein, heavy metal efflux system